MREINLDEARAARAEAEQEPVTVIFGGQKFTLPSEMSLTVVTEAQAGNLNAAILEMFDGDKAQVAAFMALKPNLADFGELITKIAQMNAITLGES